MTRAHFLAWAAAVLLALALPAGPAFAGRDLSNDDGNLDGIRRATVINKTQNQTFDEMEVEVEGKYITVRFPKGHLKMRIDGIFDRTYEIEFSARDRDSGDLYLVRFEK